MGYHVFEREMLLGVGVTSDLGDISFAGKWRALGQLRGQGDSGSGPRGHKTGSVRNSITLRS